MEGVAALEPNPWDSAAELWMLELIAVFEGIEKDGTEKDIAGADEDFSAVLKPGTDQLNVVALLETAPKFSGFDAEGINTDGKEDVDASEDMLECLVSDEKVAPSELAESRVPAYFLEISTEYRT